MKLLVIRLIGWFLTAAISTCFLGMTAYAQGSLPFKSLTVGNKFVYEQISRSFPDARFLEQVVRDTILGGKLYAVIYSTYDNSVRFERSDDNILYEYRNGLESIVHKFNVQTGDTILNVRFLGYDFPLCVVKQVERLRNTKTGDSLVFVDVQPSNSTIGYTFGYAQKLGILGVQKTIQTGPSGNSSVWYKGSLINSVVLGDTSLRFIPSATSQSQQINFNSLQLAVPNPFAASTRLNYTLTRTASVSALVYAADGVRVATLLPTTTQIAGEYSLEWNGTSSIGSAVAAGQYFVVLFVDDKQVGSIAVVKQ